MRHLWFFTVIALVPLASVGCRDRKIAVYQIPKETETTATDTASVPTSTDTTAPKNSSGLAVGKIDAGGLEWKAPASWKSKTASAMRKASYTVGEDGAAGGDMAITVFPGNVGGDLANVNRWRGQLQLPPVSEAELASTTTSLDVNGLKMLVVDLAGGPADKPQRMLGAIVPYEGATWFFKLTGADALVATEKSVYLEFLHTVRPTTATAGPAPVADSVASSPAMANTAGGMELKWTVPSHWQSKPASAMRKATYLITGEGGATADLSVTAFPGAVGGELANVNRWRGQLQLPPLAETEIEGTISRITVNGLHVALVDLTGGPADKPQRMLGAIVPSNGANWFFKLTGPEALVAKEKPAFLAFVQTLQSP